MNKGFFSRLNESYFWKKRSQCLCIYIFIYFSLKIYFCCNSDRGGNEKNKWTPKWNHFLFPQPYFRGCNPLFKHEHNDQLINRGLGQNRPLSIGECPFELKRREGLNEEYEITWLYCHCQQIVAHDGRWSHCCVEARWEIREITQMFYVSDFARRREKGGGQLSNPLFVYFVLHLCAGLSLTGGGMWPPSWVLRAAVLMRGEFTVTVGTFGCPMNPFKCVWIGWITNEHMKMMVAFG